MFAIPLLVLVCSCSWTPAEIAKEAVFEVAHAVDWRQTRTIAKNPDRYHELNPVLGRHPEVEDVDKYMIATGLIHPVITHLLPREHVIFGKKWSPRAVWQNITIVGSVGCVVNNIAVGIEMDLW